MSSEFLQRRIVLLLLAPVLALTFSACGKPSVDEHVGRAKTFVAASQLPEAVIEYRAALQIDPNRGDLRLELAELYMKLRQPGEALGQYVRAADLRPTDVTAQVKAGQLLLLAGRFQDAKTRVTKALELDPSNVDAQILLGNSLAGLKDVDGALSEYQQALSLNPSEEVAYRNIATLQMARGQAKEAEAAFRKAVEVAPKSVAARLSLGSFLWAAGRIPEAEQSLKDTLALEPNNLAANRALGTFYVGSNRLPEAEQYFKAIANEQKTPDSSIMLADYYIVAKRFDESRALLKDASADKDAYPSAMIRLAAIDVALGVRAEAERKLTELLGRHPNDMAARLLNARILAMGDKREPALAQALSILKDDANAPVAADAQMLIGSLQASLDRPEEAIKAFEDVLRRRPETMAAQLALGRLHASLGDLEKAETYITDALNGNPKNPAARAELVRVLIARRNTARAKQELAALRKEYPNALAVLTLVAAEQLASGQVEAARATYTRISQASPRDTEALTGLVTIDLATGRQQDALKRVEEGLKWPNAGGNVYVIAARTFLAVGNTQRGEELLLKAIEIEPSRLQAYTLLGVLYVKQNRLREAEANFQETAKRNPSSIASGTMLGMLYDVQRRTADAEQEYKRVLSINPDAAVAANNLAWLYVAKGRHDPETLDLAKKAYRRLPDEPNVNDTLGWIYYGQGEYSSAIKHLEASIAKDPRLPLTHYHLGLAYEAFGEREKARASLERALALKTDFEGIADAKKKIVELKD